MHSKIEPTIPSVRSGLLRSAALVALVAGTTVALGGSGGPASATNLRPSTRTATLTAASAAPIVAIGAENEYANVIGQIGGPHVEVSSILNNPNTDPHTFESSPSVAEEVSKAELIVQNGVGYDTFMNKIESASPSSSRQVITVQNLLGLPDDTPNPHLWYKPTTMPAVADAVAADLGALEPAHRTYFEDRAKAFITSLDPWLAAIAAFKAKYHDVDVATTEPVSDYLLQAMGIHNMTPWTLQADIMNGVDPSPQDISRQEGYFSAHRVQVFVYNQQVVDSLTNSFRLDALKMGIPVVGVYETMPTPGYDYQTWMLAEVHAITRAVVDKTSTEKL
jgi:zinc/manganese transport system substrate-binding protein